MFFLLLFFSVVSNQESLVVRNKLSTIIANKNNPNPNPNPPPDPNPDLPPVPVNKTLYVTSCGDATQYGCSTCLNAVVHNASSVKCGWKDTGHYVNGHEKQYICESGGSQTCPK